MLIVAGVSLVLLGLVSGVALFLAALGLIAIVPGFTLWLMFPLPCVAGYVLFAVPAPPRAIRALSIASSAVMLLLAVASVGALVLGAAGIVPQPQRTAELWYVLIVAGVLGSIGAASYGRGADAKAGAVSADPAARAES
ncbi:MAG TPA: hypothetical protein VF038_05525 [Usitatibacter sp.]|jgi:hypothetical protein